MNEAEVQYKQYCKVYARQRGIPLEEAKEHKVCKEYKKYCEEVFGCRISEEEGYVEPGRIQRLDCGESYEGI